MIDIPQANIFDSVALPFVLSAEGGYTNDPVDKGGATNYGIVQATYNAYRLKQGEYVQDVKLISEQEVRDIYYTGFWLPCKCDILMYPLNVAVFDFNVNAGSNAIKVLQDTVGVLKDGVIGANTLHAVALKTPDTATTVEFAKQYQQARVLYYQNIVSNNPSQSKFLKGWINRIKAFNNQFLS